jgi:hypothetical protein
VVAPTELRAEHVFIDTGYLQLTTGESLSEADWLDRLQDPSAELISPMPFFDCDFFLAQLRKSRLPVPRTHPYLAYCDTEALWRIAPHPVFDPVHYGDQCYRSGIGTGGPLAVHLSQHGQQRLVSCHPLLDLALYAKNANIPPERRPGDHLLTAWWSEKAEFSSFFFAKFYVANVTGMLGDVASWKGDSPGMPELCPLEHYLRTPVKNRIEANPFFDNPFYTTAYADVRLAELDPLTHFVCFGAREGRFTSMIDRKVPTDLPRRELERVQLEAIQRQ